MYIRCVDQMALKEELDRNENVFKHVAIQEAEERRLRDEELERMRLHWLEQMKVPDVHHPLRARTNAGGRK